ncbi:hypothetical protein L1887_25934 [Cichorium endivia]|nr:hypothetical protein L1887_25934 [Cichorium endivia]
MISPFLPTNQHPPATALVLPSINFNRSPPSLAFSHPSMASTNQFEFHDFLPLMADKLGGERLIEELCSGFRLLMDPVKCAITFDSLKKNSAVLGLGDLNDDDLMSMLKEGDSDGDGALNQTEFCVLMFRLSPGLMKESWCLLEALHLH